MLKNNLLSLRMSILEISKERHTEYQNDKESFKKKQKTKSTAKLKTRIKDKNL